MNTVQATETVEQLNFGLFTILNASTEPPGPVVIIAEMIADYAIYLLPLVLAFLWLRGDPKLRSGLVSTFLAAELALLFNQVISLIWFHPRPFMVPLGNTLIQHAADSSFPSDHVTFMAAVSIGLWLYSGYRLIAVVTALLTAAVAWSRIYLGVHFPLDMLGGVIVAIGGTQAIRPISGWISSALMPKLLLPLYRRVFAIPISKGLCRF